MTEQFWLAGITTGNNPYTWLLIGIYDSEERAVKACTTGNHFVGPMNLNETLPDEEEDWNGAYYPLDNIKEEG